MNKKIFYGVGSVALFSVLVLSGCNGEVTQKEKSNSVENASGQRNMAGNGTNGNQERVREEDHNASIEGIPVGELSQIEQADILKMREEEKLARDVYIILGEKWGKNTFLNIQDSEQTHTSEVKLLVDRYELTDSITDDAVGVFATSEMQDLYNKLVDSGERSLLDALIVGATVEDMDIKDLQDALGRTDNEDIKIIYTNLLEGSKKHLQSFMKNIVKEGGTYVPQYITQVEFDEIIAMDREYGGKSSSGAGNGEGLRDGSGAGTGNGGQGGMNREY